MATSPIDKIKLNTLDPNMLFAKWYPWQQFLDSIMKYSNVHGARAFLNWFPGPGRTQDNLDSLPFVYDKATKKYDLVNWNDAYKKRFVEVVTAFATAKKYLVISLIDYCSWQENKWKINPFKRSNNLQLVKGKMVPWGTDDCKMSHWTGGKETGDLGPPVNESLMVHYWAPLLDNLKALIPAKCLPYIKVECANEPRQSLDPCNIITRWLTQFYGYKKSQDWMSITGGTFDQFCTYSENYQWRGNEFGNYLSVCNVHSSRTPQEFKSTINSVKLPSIYKNIYYRMDTDGAKTPKGDYIAEPKWSKSNDNVTLLTAKEVRDILGAFSCVGIMLHCDDAMHTDAEWEKTFARMEAQLCKPIQEFA